LSDFLETGLTVGPKSLMFARCREQRTPGGR
jgi:hypothetical protein